MNKKYQIFKDFKYVMKKSSRIASGYYHFGLVNKSWFLVVRFNATEKQKRAKCKYNPKLSLLIDEYTHR